MFYAYRNAAIVGFKFQIVAFEKKARRDEMCEHTGFEPVKAETLYRKFDCKVFDIARRYPESVFDEYGRIQYIALFDVKGNFLYLR